MPCTVPHRGLPGTMRGVGLTRAPSGIKYGSPDFAMQDWHHYVEQLSRAWSCDPAKIVWAKSVSPSFLHGRGSVVQLLTAMALTAFEDGARLRALVLTSDSQTRVSSRLIARIHHEVMTALLAFEQGEWETYCNEVDADYDERVKLWREPWFRPQTRNPFFEPGTWPAWGHALTQRIATETPDF